MRMTHYERISDFMGLSCVRHVLWFLSEHRRMLSLLLLFLLEKGSKSGISLPISCNRSENPSGLMEPGLQLLIVQSEPKEQSGLIIGASWQDEGQINLNTLEVPWGDLSPRDTQEMSDWWITRRSLGTDWSWKLAAEPSPGRTKARLGASAGLPLEPRSFIFTYDAQEVIAVNSCRRCKQGAVSLSHTTNTPTRNTAKLQRLTR